MPVIVLWAVPALIVLGSGRSWLTGTVLISACSSQKNAYHLFGVYPGSIGRIVPPRPLKH
jgi:hypothetical protein